MAKYEISPCGPDRDDERQEVFRERLMAGLFGVKDGQEVPQSHYPYRQPRLTRDEERAMRERTEEALIWDEEAKRHKWKE